MTRQHKMGLLPCTDVVVADPLFLMRANTVVACTYRQCPLFKRKHQQQMLKR